MTAPQFHIPHIILCIKYIGQDSLNVQGGPVASPQPRIGQINEVTHSYHITGSPSLPS